MNKYAAILFCILLLSGAGCFLNKKQITQLPPPPEQASEPLAGDVGVTTETVSHEFVLNEHASCKVNLSYPVVQVGHIPVNTQAALDKSLLAFLQQSLNTPEAIGDFGQLDKLAEDYVEQCKQEITTEYESLSAQGEEFFTNLQRAITVTYKMTINEYHLVTFGLEEYANTGGAHPNQRMAYFNVDRGGDQILTLSDIVYPEHLRAFMKTEKAKLLEAHGGDLYPESAEEFQAIIDDRSSMSADDQVETYGGFDNFYLTPTSLVTYYNTYDIAPYAAGPITIEIPFADVKDFLSMNGPLVPLIENL